MPIKIIKQKVLKDNEDRALKIKQAFSETKTLMLNIISSPGSGKTALLEKSGSYLKEKGLSFAVLAGDCFTSRDGERLERAGINVVQINTGNACHIDASLIEAALKECDTKGLDLVIVENVGNIVCPAEFDLGENHKIALLSVTEGEDKPLKYPLLFTESDLVIINKIDLLPYLNFNLNQCKKNILKINPKIKTLETSCVSGAGIKDFIDWIQTSRTLFLRKLP